MRMELLSGTTEKLRAKLLKDQARRAERERKLPFWRKLEILDQMMRDGAPDVEIPSPEMDNGKCP
jgi:hypothetical protein